jgi:ubiquitin-activating enzyme E1
LTIHDQKAVEVRDLSAQFYLTEEDVGQNRAEACKEKLQELNNAVDVSASAAQLTPDYLEQFQVGPQHNSSSSRILQCNLLCHLLSLETS